MESKTNRLHVLISRIKIRFVAQTGYEKESFGEYPARVLNQSFILNIC